MFCLLRVIPISKHCFKFQNVSDVDNGKAGKPANF